MRRIDPPGPGLAAFPDAGPAAATRAGRVEPGHNCNKFYHVKPVIILCRSFVTKHAGAQHKDQYLYVWRLLDVALNSNMISVCSSGTTTVLTRGPATGPR